MCSFKTQKSLQSQCPFLLAIPGTVGLILGSLHPYMYEAYGDMYCNAPNHPPLARPFPKNSAISRNQAWYRMLAERAMFTPAPALCALLVAGSWAGRAAAAAVASAWNSEISGGDDQSTSYNFLAIGDWGNDDAAQHEAAAGMGAVAAEIGATQVISLGDNFYHDDDSHCSTAGGHYGGICKLRQCIDQFLGTFLKLHTIPHVPCAVRCLVHMLPGC